MEYLQSAFLDPINNNRLFWGLSMLIVNLGSRYIVGDMGKVHEKIFTSPMFKPIIFFCIFFMATRDVGISITLTLGACIILMGLLHEQSKFCLFSNIKHQATPVTDQQYQQALKIIKVYEEATAMSVEKKQENEDLSIVDKYMSMIKSFSAIK